MPRRNRQIFFGRRGVFTRMKILFKDDGAYGNYKVEGTPSGKSTLMA